MKTIKPIELESLLATRTVTLLDVRRKTDFDNAATQLPGSTWKDPERIAAWGGELPADRDVIVYCVRGGSVSNGIVERLQSAGVHARFIEGGIEAWTQFGGATVPKTVPPP